MGFHRRHISNELVNTLINDSKFIELVDLYHTGFDCISVETGIASKVNDAIINDKDNINLFLEGLKKSQDS